MTHQTPTPLPLDLIDRILPKPIRSRAEIEAQYPARTLPAGAEVTRIAPSPTGFIHIGNVYTALICERIAHQSGGVFFVRIEDTDRKREVEGARERIMAMPQRFDMAYDEGPTEYGEVGEYGPYTQSHRQEIYYAYIRELLEKGMAYPCFLSSEELEAMAERQKGAKVRPGYYGQWAVWRDRIEQDVRRELDAGKSFVIRFRSSGDVEQRLVVDDAIRGRRELPENDNDIVIMKADRLPTYHLAHVVDDYLMRTTLVLRGDEWLSSLTLHLQLCDALHIPPARYAHIAPIQKMDGSSRRKLSKRKDPEANVDYYFERGYPIEAVIEYMLNQANAAFEQWRRDNPQQPYTSFPFAISRLPKNSGALLNLVKLADVSREVLARLAPERLFEAILAWARSYDEEFATCLEQDPAYATRVFNIEREQGKRKDMALLSEARGFYGYFFDTLYQTIPTFDFGNVAEVDRKALIRGFIETYDPSNDQTTWFEKLKAVGERHGFTANTKEYRQNPEAFKGSVAEVAMVLRVALTGSNRSPNLHEVMQVMGVDRIQQRLRALT